MSGFSMEFCTAIAVEVTGVTPKELLHALPFGRVTWACSAEASRGLRGHAPLGKF